MAVVLVLAGSFLGLIGGVGALLFLNVGLLGALGIWSGSGLLFTALGLVFSVLPEWLAGLRTPRTA